jgi:hypothetical protein
VLCGIGNNCAAVANLNCKFKPYILHNREERRKQSSAQLLIFCQQVIMSLTATFFDKFNYEGNEYSYPAKDELVEVTGSLNDKFKSLKVGANTKVYAWQHYGATGKYGEWETDQPDLSYMGGISVIKVTENNSSGVWVRLQNTTGDNKEYEMTIKISEDIGSQTVPSSFPEHALVGIIPDNGQDHITQVAVREKGGSYVANGSCFFKSDGDKVIMTAGENYPSNMSYNEDNNGFFTFILNSASP